MQEGMEESLRDFLETLVSYDRAPTLSSSGATLSAGELNLSPELERFYASGFVDGLEVPWAASDMVLFSAPELWECQVGYRYLEPEGEEDPEWDNAWVVVGEVGGDPVIADTSRPGTPVSLAMHGMGVWEPKEIAPDFPSFLLLLTKWLEVSVGQFKGEIRDSDYLLRQEFCDTLKASTGERIAEKHFDALWEMLA